jgi:hypothetical protein
MFWEVAIYFAVVVVVLVAIVALGLRVISQNNAPPDYKNTLLNTIAYYRNWQYFQPANANNGLPNIPYVFMMVPPVAASKGGDPTLQTGQLELAYYDAVGYFKGFSTYLLNYKVVDMNTITLTLNKTIVNYSQIPPTFPWTLKYVDAKHLVFDNSTSKYLLQLT